MAVKRRDELTITDNFVFGSVMQNEHICKELIEAVLGEPIERVAVHHSEHGVLPRLTGRGVRLDVYLRGQDGVAYDVEMQNAPEAGFERRLGYYRSALDVDAQGRGVDYEGMCDIIVIFFARFDPFDKGFRRYDCETRVLQANQRLNDGARIVVLNSKGTKGEVEGRVEAFLRYMEDAKMIGDSLTREVDAEVQRLRMSDDWYDAYMRYQLHVEEEAAKARRKAREEGLAEGRAEGLEQGLAEGREQGRAEGREQGRAEGREQGLAEGREQGLAEGRAEGREQGLAEGAATEQELNRKLVDALQRLGRIDELSLAITNTEYRSRLLTELGLA